MTKALLKHFGAALLLVFSLPALSLTPPDTDNPYRIKTIVIDAGHGGKFSGAAGRYSVEKVKTLEVALKLGKAIEENMKDVKVVYTRTTDTHFADVNSEDLKYRIDLANKVQADLLVSIHCNSMPPSPRNRLVKGTETFVAGFARLNEQDEAIKRYVALEEEYKIADAPEDDPTAAIFVSLFKDNIREQSIKLATFIQDEYVNSGRINRGVQELSLAILRTATMPAVLTEIGFLSNAEEEDYINSEAGQNEIVANLLKAIQTYKKQRELE